MQENLFDVSTSIAFDGPRVANNDEIFAYAHWLRRSRGLPNFPGVTLRWHGGGRRVHAICIAVTFGGDNETGAYSLLLPGYNSHRQRVTMETLNEAGEVIASQTLPVEPKKGGVIWDREAVRKAFGPIPKRAKGQTIAPTPDAVPAAPEAAQEQEEALAPISDSPEALDALHGAPEPEFEAVELVSESYKLPDAPADDLAPATVKDSLTPPDADLADKLAVIMARLDAVEAALSEKADPIADASPEPRAKRSPAHERAIRRAWAERARRREAVQDAAMAWQVAELRKQKRRASVNAAMTLRRKLEAERMRCASAEAKAEREHQRAWDQWGKRRENAERARRMLAAIRERASLDHGALIAANAYAAKLASEREVAFEGKHAAEVAEARARAEIAKLKRDLADPTQPERASDIARLVSERDQARTSLAAVSARAERQQAALDQAAEHLESMGLRMAKAEAALRKAGLIAAA